MCVKEHTELVNHCCSTCCKAADFGMSIRPTGDVNPKMTPVLLTPG